MGMITGISIGIDMRYILLHVLGLDDMINIGIYIDISIA